MPLNWIELQRILSPIKDYEDLCRRWQRSFAFPFVKETYNRTMPEMVEYVQLSLGGDTRGRYNEFAGKLIHTFKELDEAGIQNVVELLTRVESRDKLGSFTEECGIPAQEIIGALKYLIYWFIPAEKYMSGLVRNDPGITQAIEALRQIGVRTNLELLQRGISAAGRKELADESGLPLATIVDQVNRADFSRMPWSSKATISNIMGAGYGSIVALASADSEKLYADFFRYGKAIGKNLKFGNEIDNSHRMAKIVPAVLQED